MKWRGYNNNVDDIPVYTPVVSLPLRVAFIFSPLLVWGALYLCVRLGGISPLRFTPWLRAVFLALMGVFLILVVLDRTRWSDIVSIHAWALLGADLWIKRRYKQDQPEPLLNPLKI